MTDKNVGKIPCPDCNGQGFYLKREGRGFYADGSFGHNQWADCDPCCGTGDARERLDYRYPKQMRERVARAIWEAGANASTTKWENASHDAKLIVYQKADAALSLMQPEIDRRVAEERERLLERLRDLAAGPAAWLDSWAMHTGNCNGGYVCTCGLTLARTEAEQLLAQFEKENSHGQ